MDFTIRLARPEDMEAVYSLIKALAEYEKEPDAVDISPEILRRDGFGNSPLFSCFVAESESEGVCGMALFYKRYSTWKGQTIHLEDLVVREDLRRSGIGKALLKQVIAHADEQGVKRLEWACLHWNTPALELYRQTGAHIAEDWDVIQLSSTDFQQFLKN